MLGAIFPTCEERPELALRIDLDTHLADIVDEVRKTIGDLGVNSRRIRLGSVLRRSNQGPSAAVGEMEKRGREMRAFAPEPRRSRERVGFAECGGFEL